jgi:hypothetical protein
MSEATNYTKKADIDKWGQELDELDSTAFAGKPVSDDEFTQIAQSYIDGTYLYNYLEKVKNKKRELLAKLAELEVIGEIQQQITKA